jgi:hypothetical protein
MSACVVLATVGTPSAQAKSCGTIKSAKLKVYLTKHQRGSAFTYRYSNCQNARSVLKGYLRRVPTLSKCQQGGCRRTVGKWKCRTPFEHGTLASCVKRKDSWSGTSRPLIGLSSYWGSSQARAARWRSCGSMAFEPRTEFGAWQIRAKGTGCSTARSVAHKAKFSKNRRAGHYRRHGFRCQAYPDTTSTLPVNKWKCKKGSKRVTFTS